MAARLVDVSCNLETTHPLDQMLGEIHARAVLCAWISRIQTGQSHLRRHRQRDLQMGQQNIISDSVHGNVRTNIEHIVN